MATKKKEESTEEPKLDKTSNPKNKNKLNKYYVSETANSLRNSEELEVQFLFYFLLFKKLDKSVNLLICSFTFIYIY